MHVQSAQVTKSHIINMLTCTGHDKLPGQAKDVVVHVKLNDDEGGSFNGRHLNLEDSRKLSNIRVTFFL